MENTANDKVGSDISWIDLEDLEADEFLVRSELQSGQLPQSSPRYDAHITSAINAIDRTSITMADTKDMESVQYQHNDESTLRRRITETMTMDQYNNNNPFLDALHEEIIKWFPNSPLRSKDQLYFNMIQGILTLKEVITTPIPALYPGSWNDSESHGFFDFLSKTLSSKPRSQSSERVVNQAIYWIHNDHIYWSILHKNFNSSAALTAVATGPNSQFLAIPKPFMDDIVEFVWNTLVKTGRVQNPTASYR